MKEIFSRITGVSLLLTAWFACASTAAAAVAAGPGIIQSRHNLSVSGPGAVRGAVRRITLSNWPREVISSR